MPILDPAVAVALKFKETRLKDPERNKIEDTRSLREGCCSIDDVKNNDLCFEKNGVTH